MGFEKADCVECLEGIRDTLENLARNTSDTWSSEYRGWLTPDFTPENRRGYDIAGSFARACKDYEIRNVLRWIELNCESGPARRERLLGVLGGLKREMRAIQSGDSSDPFRWMRDDRNATAASLTEEISEVADYVAGVVKLVEAADNKADNKNKSWGNLPENDEVTRLAKAIRNDTDGRDKIDIARDFTNNNEPKAKSLLRQLRRFPHLLNTADTADN